MPSRTFAFSRHRRRRTQQPGTGLVPAEDPAASARATGIQPGATGDVGDAVAKRRDETSLPADTDMHATGARPTAPPLPHERDETPDQPGPPRPPIVQAERDLIEGRVDTDLRNRAAVVFERALRRSRAR